MNSKEIQPRPDRWVRLVFPATALLCLLLLGWWFVFFRSQQAEIHRLQWGRMEDAARIWAERLGASVEIPRPESLPADWPADLALVPAGEGGAPLHPNHRGWSIRVRPEALERLDRESLHRHVMLLSEGGFIVLLILSGLYTLYRNGREERRRAAAMDFFVGAVNHELKTPLTGVRLVLETLRDDPAALEDPRALLDSGLGEIDRLREMVDVILLANRLAQQPLAAPERTVDVSALLADCDRRHRPRIERKGGILETHGETGLLARGEMRMIERVLDNLLDNAVKYSEGPPRVSLEARRWGGKVEVAVTDAGIGLTREEIRHVFKRFWRSDRAAGRRGVGLGLFVSRLIAESAGGSLQARSEGPGRGTEFRLTLPTE